jgi:diguanylate cyclase (GGDEF)-like protein
MGDILLSPKKKNRHLYILLSGNLYVHLKSINTKPLDIIEPGEAVGEMSVFDRKNPSAYVVASKESKVLVISENTLWTLINNTNGIARNLLHTLADRIRYGHGTILDRERRARKHAKEAYIDSLTGIHNRRWLDNMFGSEIQRASIENSPVSLLMVDVDHFKPFNDTYGHLVGDMVLRIVADSMRRKIRPNDMIARFGGEEFCILLPDTQLKYAAKLAERLRLAVMNAALMDEKTNKPLSVTISLGVAQLHPGEDLNTLLARADMALYKAKNNGRNRVEISKY